MGVDLFGGYPGVRRPFTAALIPPALLPERAAAEHFAD